MSDRSLAGKIYISMIILMVIIISSSAYTIAMINKTQEYAHETAFMWLPSVDVSKDMKYELAQLRRRELRISMTTSLKELDYHYKSIKENFDNIKILIGKYEKLINSEEEKKLFDEFTKNWKLYLSLREKFLSLVTAKRLQEASSFLLNTVDLTIHDAQTALEKIGEVNYDGSIKSTKKVNF